MISRDIIDKVREESELMKMKMEVNEALENVTQVYDSLFAISRRLDEIVISKIKTPGQTSIGDEFMRDTAPAEEPAQEEQEPEPEQPKPAPSPAPRPKPKIVQAAPVEQPKEEPKPQEAPPEPPKKRGIVDRLLRREPTEEEKKRDAMIADLEKDLDALKATKKR